MVWLVYYGELAYFECVIQPITFANVQMRRDPLSQLLELVDARTLYAGGFTSGGSWAIRFPPPRKIKFFVVARGRCQLALDGIEHPFALEAGDVFLLSRDLAFTMASDLALHPRAAEEVFAGISSGIVPLGESADFLLLGGHVDTHQAAGRLLIKSLPDYVHLPATAPGADCLGALIAELVAEAIGCAPGAEIACSSLAHLLLIQIIRRHLANKGPLEPGWLRAACDPRLGPALELMHGAPAHPWSLAELARASAMSRTAFAHHFRAVAGMPPLTYLTEWRMRLAEHALRKAGSSVARVAHSVGYGSEAAFSTAFKRVMGHSPRHRPLASAEQEPGVVLR